MLLSSKLKITFADYKWNSPFSKYENKRSTYFSKKEAQESSMTIEMVVLINICLAAFLHPPYSFCKR